jgi:hypothetical protein
MFGYRILRDADYQRLIAERDQLVADVRRAEALAAADGARAEYLRAAHNALEQDAARLRAVITKVPHTALTMEPAPTRDNPLGRGIGTPGMDAGMFEDVDDLAARYIKGESPETLFPVSPGVQHSGNETH